MTRASRHLRTCERGYALLMVLAFIGVSLLILTGALRWASTSSLQVNRNNLYYEMVAAAEAATEVAASRMISEYHQQDADAVYDNLDNYRTRVPTSSDDGYWGGVGFSDLSGGTNRIHVERTADWRYTEVLAAYGRFHVEASDYRVVARAHALEVTHPLVATVEQNLRLVRIPVCQFGVFHAFDLEIAPEHSMIIDGPVHANGSIYAEPSGNLRFLQSVTAGRQMVHGAHPQDPSVRSIGTISYDGGRTEGLSALTLPIGTNNTSEQLHKVIQVPPTSESADSPMGKQRLYNQATLRVLVKDGGVEASTGSDTIPWASISNFIRTDVQFFNKREGLDVKATEIDIEQMIDPGYYSTLTAILGGDLEALYVADLRTQINTQSGVRLVNGDTLPPAGLTVATPNPLYVKGHYNAPNSSHRGTTNTSSALPAALIADAITLLSGSWADPNSGGSLSARRASPTTVNAAIIAGMVPSGGGYYSGGLENLPRLLEDWSGLSLTINGSMAVLFNSQIATAPWGATSGIYSRPNRDWSFDRNFLDEAKLPAAIPVFRSVVRMAWFTR